MNLLIVDDHPDVRRALARLLPIGLRDAGHVGGVRVHTAENADRAVEIARAVPIEAAVLDVDLGSGDDGARLAHRLLELRPSIRIVFHTGLPGWRPPPELALCPVLAKGAAVEELVETILSATTTATPP